MKTIDALNEQAWDELEDLVLAAQEQPKRFSNASLTLIERLHRTFLRGGWLVQINLTEQLAIHKLHSTYIEHVELNA